MLSYIIQHQHITREAIADDGHHLSMAPHRMQSHRQSQPRQLLGRTQTVQRDPDVVLEKIKQRNADSRNKGCEHDQGADLEVK
ncbi:unnamed protein product, partial [Musa acuminata var. zebrina]